jgi:hypothetical protein
MIRLDTKEDYALNNINFETYAGENINADSRLNFGSPVNKRIQPKKSNSRTNIVRSE